MRNGHFLVKLDKIISHVKMPLVHLLVTLIILVQKTFEISVIENAKLKEMKNFSTLTMILWRLFSRRIQIHQEIIQDLESSGMFMIDQIQLHHHHQTVSNSTTQHQPTTPMNHTNEPHHHTIQVVFNTIIKCQQMFYNDGQLKNSPTNFGEFSDLHENMWHAVNSKLKPNNVTIVTRCNALIVASIDSLKLRDF